MPPVFYLGAAQKQRRDGFESTVQFARERWSWWEVNLWSDSGRGPPRVWALPGLCTGLFLSVRRLLREGGGGRRCIPPGLRPDQRAGLLKIFDVEWCTE